MEENEVLIDSGSANSSARIISILIPTLNEKEGIERTIRRIPIKELGLLGYSCEILIVDGGSIDGTREVAKRLGANVIPEPRKGYGRAYKTGFFHARGDIIATLDGDGSYPPELIPKLVKLLVENNLDFVNTRRILTPGSMSLLHRFGNIILTFLARILFRVKLQDSQSGMWIFRKDILKYIMPESDGMSFSEEIKIRAFLYTKASEFPIPYKKRIGKPKLKTIGDGIQDLLFLLRLKLRKIGGVYHDNSVRL